MSSNSDRVAVLNLISGVILMKWLLSNACGVLEINFRTDFYQVN